MAVIGGCLQLGGFSNRATIIGTTPLGPEYLTILNEVARLQRRTPFKNHVSMSAESTLTDAMAFLMSAIQN